MTNTVSSLRIEQGFPVYTLEHRETVVQCTANLPTVAVAATAVNTVQRETEEGFTAIDLFNAQGVKLMTILYAAPWASRGITCPYCGSQHPTAEAAAECEDNAWEDLINNSYNDR